MPKLEAYVLEFLRLFSSTLAICAVGWVISLPILTYFGISTFIPLSYVFFHAFWPALLFTRIRCERCDVKGNGN